MLAIIFIFHYCFIIYMLVIRWEYFFSMTIIIDVFDVHDDDYDYDDKNVNINEKWSKTDQWKKIYPPKKNKEQGNFPFIIFFRGNGIRCHRQKMRIFFLFFCYICLLVCLFQQKESRKDSMTATGTHKSNIELIIINNK